MIAINSTTLKGGREDRLLKYCPLCPNCTSFSVFHYFSNIFFLIAFEVSSRDLKLLFLFFPWPEFAKKGNYWYWCFIWQQLADSVFNWNIPTLVPSSVQHSLFSYSWMPHTFPFQCKTPWSSLYLARMCILDHPALDFSIYECQLLTLLSPLNKNMIQIWQPYFSQSNQNFFWIMNLGSRKINVTYLKFKSQLDLLALCLFFQEKFKMATSCSKKIHNELILFKSTK